MEQLTEKTVNGSIVTFRDDSNKRENKIMKPKELRLSVPTIEGIAKYIKEKPCKNIIVLSGAGISTNSGIPDVRTPGSGLYYIMADSSLPYVHAVFENEFFKKNPKPLFRMVHTFLSGNFVPSLSHYFVTILQRKNILLKNYTQNLDDLERLAGVTDDKLGQIYGTLNRFFCQRCRIEYSPGWVKEKLDEDAIPQCDCGGNIKPKVFLYGEALPKQFCNDMAEDFKKCDLLIIMGTSLRDEPVASMPFFVGKSCPRLVINATELSKSLGFDFLSPVRRDVICLGDCDVGCQKLLDLLGWSSDMEELIQDSVNRNV